VGVKLADEKRKADFSYDDDCISMPAIRRVDTTHSPVASNRM